MISLYEKKFGGNETNDSVEAAQGLRATGIDSTNLIDGMQLYILVVAAFIIIMLAQYALAKVPAIREQVLAIIRSTLDGLLFNGAIMSIELQWLNHCLMAAASFTIPLMKQELGEEIDPTGDYL